MPPHLVKTATIIWLVLLIPWLLIAGLVGMAFDAGYTPAAYLLAWSVWTYPVTLVIALVLKKRKPVLVLLPLVNFLFPIAVAALMDVVGVPRQPVPIHTTQPKKATSENRK